MMVRWSGEGPVNGRWISGEYQISIWAWYWWTSLFMSWFPVMSSRVMQEVTSTHPRQESHCHPVRWLMFESDNNILLRVIQFQQECQTFKEPKRTTKTKWPFFRTAVTLMKRFCKENPVERIGYQKDGVHDIKKHRWFQVRQAFF